MISVRDMEVAMLAAWPGLESVSEGAWQARFGGGLTRRANCINCLDPEDETKPAQRLGTLAAQYRARDLPVIFRVTPLTGRAAFDMLEVRGWMPNASSLVLEAQAIRAAGYDAKVAVLPVTDPDFHAAQAALQAYSERQAETFAKITANIAVPAKGLVLADADGVPQASALCALGYGTGVFVNVVTDRQVRRQGLARRIMESGLSWLADNGAKNYCLQVEAENGPAIGLYLSMGFAYRYPYHYRLEPQ